MWYGLAGTAFFLILWTVIGYAVFSGPEYQQFSGFLPIPTLKALLSLMIDADFWFSVGASLSRVVIGIFFAFVTGVPSGLLIGFYRKIMLLTYTPIQFLRMISPLSWMPIALLIFRSFESAIWFLIAMATVWPIIINTAHGVSQVDIHWINMARNQGAGDHQLLLKIIIPASIPFILTSIRLALGVAWIVLVPAEFLGISSGLGYLINDARDTMSYDRLMAIVIAIGLIGFILDGAVGLFQKRMG
ncbi:MAG: ABC transporter permease [Desulfobacterales bacterium]